MTYSNLLYNKYTLNQIAGMDDAQIALVYFRKRDKYGRLIEFSKKKKKQKQAELLKVPEDQQTDFESMFLGCCRAKGMTEEQAQKEWESYLKENPGLSGHVAMQKEVLT